MNSNTLKLRSRLATSHQLPVNTLDHEVFQKQLTDTVTKAPGLFHLAPTILDMSDLNENITPSHLESILQICRAIKLVPFALTGDRERHKPLAEQLSMAWLDHKAGNANRESTNIEKIEVIKNTKVITTPVRSGQQIYAKDAHLLIMNQVSAGAEIIADGNIHVFGALRGRAIAGAQGASVSEIICQQMEAELIAIAGTYLVQDDFPSGKGAARCRLEGDHINIDYI